MWITNDWSDFIKKESEKNYMKELFGFLTKEYAENTIYPPKDKVFAAFQLTPYAEVNVVILGQDPYHGPNQANGLSFSVEDGVPFPPSLRNIFKELVSDIGCDFPSSGDLTPWAKQGVLLLNTALTVRAGSAMSHSGKGWEIFTDEVLQYLNEKKTPIVFILWGKHAQTKIKFIDQDKHFIIKSVHPSPLSAHRGFFGSQPFSKTNNYLEVAGLPHIDWNLR